MHKLEAVLRKCLSRTIEFTDRLPARYGVPLLNVLLDIPEFAAKGKGFTAVTSYWDLSSPLSGDAGCLDVGILIQGPVASVDKALEVEETVRLYRALFGDIPIVVSTWDSSISMLSRTALSEMCQIVYSEDPGNSFPTNIDRQAKSTSAGLARLAEIGCTFSLKSRVDHRIYAANSLKYLRSIWGLIPNEDRIVVSSYGTGKYRVYGATEQLQFGKIETLQKYWDGTPSKESHDVITGPNGLSSALSFQSLAVHETRLNVRYLSRIGRQVSWTWLDHLEALKDTFAIADSLCLKHVQLGRPRSVLDHVYPWNSPKVNRIEEHLSFGDWLCLISSSNDVEAPGSFVLLEALKVPESDKERLQTLFVKSRP